MRIHARDFLLWNSLMILEEIIRMATPFVISALLGYFQDIIPLSTALLYGLILALGVSINSIVHHPLFLYNHLTGMRLRLACSGLIYKKVA